MRYSTMHNPFDKLLSRLDKVTAKKPTKNGLNQWQARCPSHADKSPSLVITECVDGTVLLKCWAGCTTDEIVNSIGLELKDLFAHSSNKQSNNPQVHKKHPSKKAIEHEQLIIQIAQSQLKKGRVLTPTDQQRYQQAKQRLSLLNNEVR